MNVIPQPDAREKRPTFPWEAVGEPERSSIFLPPYSRDPYHPDPYAG